MSHRAAIITSIIVIIVVGFLFWLIIATGQRNNIIKDLCTENNMNSIVINKGKTVLCIDDKGRVFYLR